MSKTKRSDIKLLNPAEYTILVFGGCTPISRLLNLDRTAVFKWKSYQGVPRKHHIELLTLAEKNKIDLTAQDLVQGRKLKIK